MNRHIICRFFDKTKNEWEHRAHFEKVAGKYDMLFVDYSTEDKVKRHFCAQSIVLYCIYVSIFFNLIKTYFFLSPGEGYSCGVLPFSKALPTKLQSPVSTRAYM